VQAERRLSFTMKNGLAGFDAVTVTLNPAIDRTVTIPNFTG
jgi:hypothetical protein